MTSAKKQIAELRKLRSELRAAKARLAATPPGPTTWQIIIEAVAEAFRSEADSSTKFDNRRSQPTITT